MGIQDTFQLYGSGFQNKLLAVLMKDRIYLQQIHDILDPSYFSSESSQWIAGTIMKYFNTYKSSPTLEVMKVEVDSVENGVLKTTIVDTPAAKMIFKLKISFVVKTFRNQKPYT